ncbi:DUF3298 and DUF4163 domain-containing protein [Mariniflexile ostreae]|uniref:DUF3298 and DUF4163 domain-containing protein n=1 Tax=Mariniflexile ostreae TaxID=1520892 RepID=A0ABV5F7S9_9FLAO
MSKRPYYIVICLFLLLNSCKNETNLSFSETEITTPNNTIVQVNIPKANNSNVVSKNINAEINKTVITSLHLGEPDVINSTSIEESIIAFNDEYNAFQSDFPETAQAWEAQVDGDVMYQSPEIISIAITSYVNTGGAHGILNIVVLNFDGETGEPLENSTLIKDKETFKTVLKSHFQNATKDKDVFTDNDSLELPANMGYSKEGFVMLYNAYEVAPYSTGIIQFAIPFDELEGLLNFNSL